ncbi:hypothetical protein ALC62_01592 [Cyphomyrmex costatus]|uniref:Uncharacterized protein n=1 Tax=Cyphomyrmex costatus TaxID=456900 RepID=A0A195D3A2_9HYME|nr:hypothetical protein ALC62_01592 [Cyphomyrmex costatus]
MNQKAINCSSMSSPRKDLVLRITMELAHPFLKTYRITAKRCGEEEDEEDRPSRTITRRTKSRSANEHFFHAIPAARCYFPDEIERIDTGNERRTEV